MNENVIVEELVARLNSKNIFELRQIARAMGVFKPTDRKKQELISDIMSITTGVENPKPRSKRGAPVKWAEYDKKLVGDLKRCREFYLGGETEGEGGAATISVEAIGGMDEEKVTGWIEDRDGKYFLRGGGDASSMEEVFVSKTLVNRYALRNGDKVCGRAKRSGENERRGLLSVLTVNGNTPGNEMSRGQFKEFTAVYPDKRLKSSVDDSGVILDLVTPFVAGQRALLAVPDGMDSTASLVSYVSGLAKNNEELNIVFIVVYGAAEKVNMYKRELPNAEYFFPFGSGDSMYRTANLALSYCCHLAEQGKDSLVVVDDFTRLATDMSLSLGRSEGLDRNVRKQLSDFICTARNTEEGGSVSLLAVMTSDSSDPVDKSIYLTLRKQFNMKIVLSEQLSRYHVDPPVNLAESMALNEERYLSPIELKALISLRRKLDGGADDEEIIVSSNHYTSTEQLARALNKK